MVEATSAVSIRDFLATPLTQAGMGTSCAPSKHGRQPMKNRDELKGKFEEMKGKAKQAWSHLTGNERLRNEGVEDEAAGDVEQTLGRGRRKVGEAIEDLGEDIKR
jgi:uncharacterized protein YjbJ (UPF0337 family)